MNLPPPQPEFSTPPATGGVKPPPQPQPMPQVTFPRADPPPRPPLPPLPQIPMNPHEGVSQRADAYVAASQFPPSAPQIEGQPTADLFQQNYANYIAALRSEQQRQAAVEQEKRNEKLRDEQSEYGMGIVDEQAVRQWRVWLTSLVPCLLLGGVLGAGVYFFFGRRN